MLQLRIVFHTIFRILHDGGDNAGRLTFPHDVVASPRARPVADDLIELSLICDPRLVGGEFSIKDKTRLFHHKAQGFELYLGLARDESTNPDHYDPCPRNDTYCAEPGPETPRDCPAENPADGCVAR